MSTDYERIAQAISYLEENFQAQPSLDEVAAHLHLSPYYFQRLFREWAGVSPKRFLQFITLSHAKHLLREKASILDTSYEAGLSSPGRLHDLFVSVEAVTPGEFKTQGREMPIHYGFHETPFGDCLLATTERGICHLSFVGAAGREAALSRLRKQWQAATLREEPTQTAPLIPKIFPAAPQQGREKITLLLKGTNFQVQVWQALLKIPSGAACSYGDVAAAIGKPQASRAVGTAVGANQIGYLIPCHRVIRQGGHFGGYQWEPTRKKAILGWEAAQRAA